MESVVKEMQEEFIISYACSKYFAIVGEDTDAQDFKYYYKYMKHAKICKEGSIACLNFFKTNDLSFLIKEFKRLGLWENVNILQDMNK